MKTKIKHLLTAGTVICFLLLAFGSASPKKTMTVADRQIPPDFHGYKGTLLIVRQSSSWNKYANKYFTANYHGKFVMIDKTELDTKYSDKNSYRFALGRDLEFSRDINLSTGTSNTYASSEALCLTDRQTTQTYCTAQSALYGKLLKAYSAALEAERLR